VRVAQGLEKDELRLALLDQGFDGSQRAELEVAKGLGVAFVVDLELGYLIQAVRQHIGAGALDTEQEYRRGGRLPVTPCPAPPRLPQSALSADQRIDIVLFYEMCPPVCLAPPPVLPKLAEEDVSRVSCLVDQHWPLLADIPAGTINSADRSLSRSDIRSEIADARTSNASGPRTAWDGNARPSPRAELLRSQGLRDPEPRVKCRSVSGSCAGDDRALSG
jgi:hypothetical protein